MSSDQDQAMSLSRVHRGTGKGKKMEVNEADEAEAPTLTPKSLEEILSDYREPIRQPFIYKVQNYYLRDENDKVHEPRMVAIGPYHHGKQSLKMMEQHKLRYLKSLLLRKNEKVDRYLSAIAEIEEEARSCDAEELSYFSSAEFIEMLVLDACFIIELLRNFRRRDSTCASDPIFQMMWFRENLRRDLVLFENQIPFFVLCKLFDLIHEGGPFPNQQEKLIVSISHFLGLGPIDRVNVKLEEVRHLLHLRHATLRPSSRLYIDLNVCPRQREFRLIPSATELKDANITFCKRQGGTGCMSTLFEVDFSDGVLTMSTLSLHDGTDGILRNLIMYEQYFPDGRPTYVTDYVAMLDFLVNTGRDVEILSECGIIHNITGHNQVAADIINRLAKFAMVPQTHFIYADTFNKINAHHKRWWNRARVALIRDYFNTPWAYISFFAAVFLLLLTLAQTIISAIQL